ncbi:MAG: metal ABC transporter ATP-binding protein [Bacteroidota bacterium]
MVQPLLSIQHMSTGYGSTKVLHDVTIDVFPGDFIGVIGPNGGGKTTFVKAILGLLPVFSGKISFPTGKPKMGYLPQLSQIDRNFPITVKDLVASGIRLKNRLIPLLKKEEKKKLNTMIHDAGLWNFQNRPIADLSGGQLQKALLGRALIDNPELLILDEPNTFIDKSFEKDLYQWLEKLNPTMSIILVSHDIGAITPMVKTIACVNGNLHYHQSNHISADILKVYNCPVDLIAHGPVPHRVLKDHE